MIQVAVGIARRRLHDPVHALEEMLHAPEASSGKIDLPFHPYSISSDRAS